MTNISTLGAEFDFRLYSDRFSNLPKWARDERINYCENKEKLTAKIALTWLKEVSTFLF